MASQLIKKVTILDLQSPFHEKVVDILIEDGIIKKIAKKIEDSDAAILDGINKFISQGWISLMTDFAEPGYEHRENIQSGLDAAQNGGFAQVVLVPNTNPSISNKSTLKSVLENAKGHKIKLHAMGSISQNIDGKALAEMQEMHEAGALAFTDGWKPLEHAGLMQKALEYVKSFDGLIVELPLLSSLTDGLMNESEYSVKFGLPGIPNIAESLMVNRDIELARYTNSRIHLTGITTAESLQLIKNAKKSGVKVTCSVTPFHLLFTEKKLESYNSLFKVYPPLRSEKDRKALIKALEDGTIDCIAIHHKPHNWDEKEVEFEYAKSGMASLETAWPMLLQAAPHLEMKKWTDLLYNNAAEIFRIKATTIEEGARLPLTLFDTSTEWILTQEKTKSKAYNIPLLNTTLKGKATVI
ncbi:MAG TPA: dihydroorotase [Edaphocola sp.]|nr:dihydroorotase [Edaphocola sp.]